MIPDSPVAILTLGFLLGLKHATDADHVVAVTTIVSRQRKLRHAAMVGITWGIGHTMMIVVVGIALLMFKIAIPDRVQLLFEFIVACALIVLGIMNLTGSMRRLMDRVGSVHSHVHTHDRLHVHVHTHEADIPVASGIHEDITDFIGQYGYFHLLRPLVVGIIHGLAGSAGVTLLVLGSIPDQTTGIIYLGIFGVGTIVGMMLVTTLMGIPLIAGSKRMANFDRWASRIAGVISILYGLSFGYEIGITRGLFASF